jgi:hypothetical protein
VGVVLIEGLAACKTQSAGDDAARVARKHLEAEKNNDYEAWISTLIEEKQNAHTEEAKGFNAEFGVISLTVDKVYV